jgi:hypothetical protein
MTTSEIPTEALPNGHQGNGEWLQITPGERFKIRTSVEETEGAFATHELVADPRNGTPMPLVFSPGHIERLFREVAARENDDIAAILEKLAVSLSALRYLRALMQSVRRAT